MQQVTQGIRRVLMLGVLLPVVPYVGLHSGVDLFGPIRVGGLTVKRGEAGATALRAHAAHWSKAQVTIHVGPYVAHATRSQLGAKLPIEAAQQRLRTLGSTGNPFTDLAALWSSHRGGLALALRPEIARSVLSDRIQELRHRLERPPVPGALLNDGKLLPGIPGITINSVTAMDSLERSLVAGVQDVQLDTTRITPGRPVSYTHGHAAADATQFGQAMVLVETAYRSAGSAAGRAHNIELAAQALHGAVMEPGGELSFNQVVGARTWERGFETAKELANRRVVDGVGGGVCQVAATLHAAAFLSGFALPEYRPHSRPALYIELGLDTMVAWPNQDMRIANPYPFAVRVNATASNGVLQIRLEGSGKPHPVEWNTEILQRTRAGTQQVTDPSLARGQTQVIQEAIDGLTVRRTRTIYWPTGPKTEESILRYPANDRIVAMGRAGTATAAAARGHSRLDEGEF